MKTSVYGIYNISLKSSLHYNVCPKHFVSDIRWSENQNIILCPNFPPSPRQATDDNIILSGKGAIGIPDN